MVNAPSGAAAGADATGVGAVCDETETAPRSRSEAPSVAFAPRSRSRANLDARAPVLRADGTAEAMSFCGATRTRHPASILGIFLVFVLSSSPGEEGGEARRSGRVGSDARAGFGENPTGAPSGSRPKDAPGERTRDRGPHRSCGSRPTTRTARRPSRRPRRERSTDGNDADARVDRRGIRPNDPDADGYAVSTRVGTRRATVAEARGADSEARARKAKEGSARFETRESIVYEVVWMGTSSTARFPGTDVDSSFRCVRGSAKHGKKPQRTARVAQPRPSAGSSQRLARRVSK